MRLRFCRMLKDSTGVSAIEFAIISPVLITILLGIFQFGSAMNAYLVLTNAAAKGALTIALGRGTATPYTTTISAITAAAPNLTPANITTTVTINGTACSTDAGCTTAARGGRLGRREDHLSLQPDRHGHQLRAERLHPEGADCANGSMRRTRS